MKKTFVLLMALLCVSAAQAQESGNRIYGNRGYYNQQRRQPLTNNGQLYGTGYAIEASVLTNLKPDAFVAVFGINEEAKAASQPPHSIWPCYFRGCYRLLRANASRSIRNCHN